MSEVALQIAGRTWRVACAPGEEDRVQRLGATVAEKLATMGATGAADAQNMLFAALLLADEVLEGRDAVARSAEEADNANEAASQARRDAETATGARDQLKATIADLERELGRLQSAQKGSADEMEKVLSIQSDLRKTIAKHEAENADLRNKLIAARQERDDALSAAPAEATTPAPAGEDNAAPSLERFAELLEACADRLEARS